jgi:hypothetical protein
LQPLVIAVFSVTVTRCSGLGIHQALTLPDALSDEGPGEKLFCVPHVAPAGHSLLFAVGAWPPHDGVRRTRCLNLSRDLEGIVASRFRTLNEIT